MDQATTQEVKTTYYSYVLNISNGIKSIARKLRMAQLEEAFTSIGDLAEGLQWLLQAENELKEQNYFISSQLDVVVNMMDEVNEGLEAKDYFTVADFLEYEIAPMFDSASEWTFEVRK